MDGNQIEDRNVGSLSAGRSCGLVEPLTGIILAGGNSRRMGREKAFLELGGRPLVEIVIERVQQACKEVLLVAGDPDRYRHLGVPVVRDVFRGAGVLAGLHAGIAAASHDLTVAVGCDMPFLVPDLLRAFGNWAKDVDVVVLREGGLVEPLHGAYRRTCIAPIEAAIREGQRRIVAFFPRVRVRYVTATDVAPFDRALSSIRNVNTPEEWEAVQAEYVGARVIPAE